MAMLASTIIQRALVILQDNAGVRWPFAELYEWLYDAQLAIVLAKPSANSSSVEMQLQPGTLQRLTDSEHVLLLRIIRNLGGAPGARIGGRVVRPTTRDVLDAAAPDWHYTTPRAEVRQIIFDDSCPREFYVYPPNDGTGVLELVVSVVPEMPPVTGDPSEIRSYDVPLSLADIYLPPVLDFVLHRAFSKDDIGASASRAALHYQQFATAVGIKVQVDRSSSPNAGAGVTAS